MLNVKNKKCIICNLKYPCYNKPNEKIATHCAKCKLPGMINIKNKKCMICKNKVPIFNYPNETKGTHCNDCKLPEMIDVINKKCIICNLKRPYFNKPNETKGTHCAKCKLPEMIDVKNKKCIICQKKQPSFNKPNEKIATHCNDCKLPEMIDVIHKKCMICQKKQPYFNKPNETKGTHCNACKLPGMVDVINKKFQCKNCQLEWREYKKGQELCSYCNPTKRQKTKEIQIHKLLERCKIEFINDKTIQNNCCYKYRPDFLIDCNSYFIVLEVDENAHNQYNKECELIRMNNISYSLGLPVKFIRYNPDNKTYSKKHKESALITELSKYIGLDILEDLETIYLFY